MNTIPTIGPDAAIAPRTGSGSPQTPPQQRADAAPAVLADSAAKADPGVMLKVVPPAVPRDTSTGVRPPPQDQLAGLISALFGGAEPEDDDPRMALPPGVSPEDLPEGLTPQQLQAWLRGLFRNAIDQDEALLQRLAASLESLPPETQEAMQKASTPAMAQLLKFAALTEPARKDAPARISAGPTPLAQDPEQAAARLIESIRQALPFQLAAKVQEAMPAQAAATQAAAAGTQAAGTQAAGAPQAANGTSVTPQQAPVLTPQQAPVLTPQQADEALRDALRLLMDGRLQWQGVLTPGVPLQLERSDAWQASRHATGGMEKGSSIRLRLQLPNLGAMELRALGFAGQVSVRIHADEQATPALAKALPSLQAKLHDRGLAGAQIALDSL
jgi:hypothetical protein